MDPLGGLNLRGCTSPAPYWNGLEDGLYMWSRSVVQFWRFVELVRRFPRKTLWDGVKKI